MPEPHTIEYVTRVLDEKGFQLLSTEYPGSRKKIIFKCKACGFIRNTLFSQVHTKNTGCRRCANKANWEKRPRITLANLTEFAKLQDQQGKCLSTEYLGYHENHIWQCGENHTWPASVANIRKHWCPTCAGNAKGSIEKMQVIAIERGGLCLSTEYFNEYTKLRWSCHIGHEWEATPQSIKADSWCTECRPWYGELLCRLYFETIFKQEEFPSHKPEWLINDKTSRRLQLDGYCESLGIAFEHQGSQHYKVVKHHKKGEKGLAEQKERDAIKVKRCAERGVKLFVIPQTTDRTDKRFLKQIIKDEAMRLAVKLPDDYDEIYVNHNKVYQLVKAAPHRFKKSKRLSKGDLNNSAETANQLRLVFNQKLV